MKKKIEKYIIYFVLSIIILFFILGHPFIHFKYWYQNLTGNNSEHFSIADGYYRKSQYDDIFYESKCYLNSNPNDNTEYFDVSDFDENGLIYIQAYLYDSLNDVKVYLNGNALHSTIDTDYYSIFSDNFYIVKTIRIWIYKKDLTLNNVNKLDYVVGDKVYTYYFNSVKN